jgi:hypothetical protein
MTIVEKVDEWIEELERKIDEVKDSFAGEEDERRLEDLEWALADALTIKATLEGDDITFPDLPDDFDDLVKQAARQVEVYETIAKTVNNLAGYAKQLTGFIAKYGKYLVAL